MRLLLGMIAKDFGSHYNHATRTIFTLGNCESCNGLVQEPNAIGCTNLTEETAVLRHSLVLWLPNELPPELSYDDEKGMAVCDDCITI